MLMTMTTNHSHSDAALRITTEYVLPTCGKNPLGSDCKDYPGSRRVSIPRTVLRVTHTGVSSSWLVNRLDEHHLIAADASRKLPVESPSLDAPESTKQINTHPGAILNASVLATTDDLRSNIPRPNGGQINGPL